MIFRIARNELANLFYTPIVWLLFIIFIIYTELSITSSLDGLVKAFERSGPETFLVTYRVFFGSSGGLFVNIINVLLYLTPLLTMRIMTREQSTGSIKLLYSSPIKNSSIILGKYLALVIVVLLFWITAALLTGILAHYIERVNYALLLSGLLSIALLWCTYAAIGLFISCLTRYQIVAAIASIALLAGLHYCGSLWQWKDGVREVTDWICISGRTNNMLRGLITSADIIYFLLISVFFLAITIYTMEFKRRGKVRSFSLKLSGVVLSIAFLASISSIKQNIIYWDVTEHKTNTLSQSSQEILTPIDQPIIVCTYVNVLGPNFSYGTPKNRLRDIEQFEEYSRFLPSWEMDYVYYYHQCDNERLFSKNKDLSLKEITEKLCKLEHIRMEEVLTPEEIDARIDLSAEEYKFVREIKYKDRRIFLRLFNDRSKFPGEAEITAALNSFLNPPMQVGILQGHLERDMYGIQKEDMKDVLTGRFTRHALINNGFIPKEISLKDGEIPADLVFLLIADPLQAYTADELAKIQHYIDAGGNLIINGSIQSRSTLQPLLSRFDIKLGDHPLVEIDMFGNYEQILSYSTATAAEKLHRSFDMGRYSVSFPSATALHLPESIVTLTDSSETLKQSQIYTTNGGETFEYVPVLATSDTVWMEFDKASIKSRNLPLFCDSLVGEEMKSYQIAIALLRQVNNRDQKIIIVSCADYISNEGNKAAKLRRITSQGNGHFFKGIVRWMSDGELPVHIESKRESDRFFYMGMKEYKAFKILWLGVFPSIILGISLLLLWRRKRR